MNRDEAMRKIRACLRLSKSANAHEAAAALRHARALMDKYGLSEADAAAAEITSADAATRSQGAMVPNSIVFLAQIIADGYRCRVLVNCYRVRGGGKGGKTRVEFYGYRSDAQVSAYAFTVLRRQLEADRSAVLSGTVKQGRRKVTASRRAQLGETFALGWVSAVRDLFPREEISTAHDHALQLAIKKQNVETKPVVVAPKNGGTKKESREELEAQLAGFLAGSQAKLHRGVGKDTATGSLFTPVTLEHQR